MNTDIMKARCVKRLFGFQAVAVCGLACLIVNISDVASSCASRPNVLFIAVDDMNDWTGFLGGYDGPVHTPHLDRLADSGLLFENAHCAAPVCNPSRTALLTGLRPSTTGIYDNGSWWRPALPDVVTLPECFSNAGFHVAGGGKIFHHTPGFNPPEQWHFYFEQVFDDPWHRPKRNEVLPVSGIHWPDGFPLCELENVRLGIRPPANPREFDWGALQRTDAEMGDGQAVAWASEFLQQQHDDSFFLAVGIFRPHLPWYSPQKYFDLYPLEQIVLPDVRADDLDDVPAAGIEFAEARGDEWRLVADAGRWRHAVQAYLASISFSDAMVGQLLRKLDESHYAANTIVVLWSDHGWHLGEKHHWHKSTLWEEATRVPLIIAAPGVTQPGSRTRSPVGLIDLYPTLIDLCDLPPNPSLDGTSLKPLLKQPARVWQQPAITTHGRGNHAVRSERYRYIRYADGSEELYDHRNDPRELKNLLYAGNASDASEMAALTQVRDQLSAFLPESDANAARGKKAYRFDPQKYLWTVKE